MTGITGGNNLLGLKDLCHAKDAPAHVGWFKEIDNEAKKKDRIFAETIIKDKARFKQILDLGVYTRFKNDVGLAQRSPV